VTFASMLVELGLVSLFLAAVLAWCFKPRIPILHHIGLARAADTGIYLSPPPGVKVDSAAYAHAHSLPAMSNREMEKFGLAMLKGIMKEVFWNMNPLLRFSPEPPAKPPDVGLSQRARGWLKYLYEKATEETLVAWSEEGDPSLKWDRWSMGPMCSFPRFDLHESAYAVALMADALPAWREPFVRITDELASKYTTHWSAVDFLNQFGNDPHRGEYSLKWRGVIVPTELFGNYDAPGWTANGLGKYPDGTAEGVCEDPIKAESMLFFKGWLLLTMGLHAHVSGDDKYFQEWQMANVAGGNSTWTLDGVAAHLHKQWSERPSGVP